MIAFTVTGAMFAVTAMLRFEPLSFAIGSSMKKCASPRVMGGHSDAPLQVIECRRPRRLHLDPTQLAAVLELDLCSLFVLAGFFEKPHAPEDLPFRVIRVNSDDQVIARANNLLVGRAAYETAVRLYPGDVIQYREGRGLLRGAIEN
jgi:hypothetical protein